MQIFSVHEIQIGRPFVVRSITCKQVYQYKKLNSYVKILVALRSTTYVGYARQTLNVLNVRYSYVIRTLSIHSLILTVCSFKCSFNFSTQNVQCDCTITEAPFFSLPAILPWEFPYSQIKRTVHD